MASVDSVPAYMLPGVPVVQPPHLEGDPSLATEILPGPPPLLSIQQPGFARKDHRKQPTVVSYLPVSDPGTTYQGHMVSAIVPPTSDVDGPRRKRSRIDKGTSSRAQRASARNLGVAVAPPADVALLDEAVASSSHIITDADTIMVPIDSDDPMLSRSNSVFHVDEPHSVSATTRRGAPRKDKGKGREKDVVVRVKEEPNTVSLSMTELGPGLPNEDHCSSCRSLGSLVYCDGCPRAFHLWCLDPPMAASDLPEGDERWYCPACTNQQKPPPKISAKLKFIAPLLEHLATIIPAEYSLPNEIKTHFKDVATGPRGAYVDTSEIKAPRLNRLGQVEDRDPYRLKDRNGDPVLCFQCGTSALPPAVAATSPAAKRTKRDHNTFHDNPRAIITCDYCHLHWHLDCLDPPLACMPPWSKKWMCPNHADQVLRPKRRIPRMNATPIDITSPLQRNNGNVEIIQSESSAPPVPKVAVDEVLINGRRYRVPERVIQLDFWSKVGKSHGQSDDPMSSPLTSLSSLDESVGPNSVIPPLSYLSVEDVKLAHLLTGLRLGKDIHSADMTATATHESAVKLYTNSAVQTGAKSSEGKVLIASGSQRPPAAPANILSAVASTPAANPVVAPKRTRSRLLPRPEPERQRAIAAQHPVSDSELTPMDVDPAPVVSAKPRRGGRRRVEPKQEEPPSPVLHTHPQTNGALSTASSSRGRREATNGRVSRTPRQKPVRESASVVGLRPIRRAARNRAYEELSSDSEAAVSAEEAPIVPAPSKHSGSPYTTRKRHGTDSKDSAIPGHPPKGPATKKAVLPPASPEPPSAVKPSGATPSLKIRLPRLSSLGNGNGPVLSAPSSIIPAPDTSPALRKSQAATYGRARRAHRGPPAKAETNGAGISSEASSSRLNDTGTTVSPISQST
ncbi:hypothetical protein CERSUDRAFT_113863 [Gelatoporia subvermispora B]|uniref:PHD-type domain-containing protein n=1 Tax=Ceriporiopsis subvermispora (strain B) TaxID=914234 RepID=M2R2C3_CERS8|nr:hypothetical protein CERSUDRAFT_113863 [Gelatoporia subvermispora B]